MTNDMLPIIRQMNEADGDRERARLLLTMPDTVVLKYAGTLGEACLRARFPAGVEYLQRRLANMLAVRGPDGLLPRPLAEDFDAFRSGFARFAAFDPQATEL